MFRCFRHPLGRPRGLFSLVSTFEELLLHVCKVTSPRTVRPSLLVWGVDPAAAGVSGKGVNSVGDPDSLSVVGD